MMKNARLWTIGLFVAVVCSVMFLSMSGCGTPPGTVVYGSGLALDANNDGIADVDENGEVIVLPDSAGYQTTAKIDAVAPTILSAGSVIPGGIGIMLGSLGVMWKNYGFGRKVSNLIYSIQKGREALAAAPDKFEGALEVFDTTLKIVQDSEVTKMVRDVKAKLKEPLTKAT